MLFFCSRGGGVVTHSVWWKLRLVTCGGSLREGYCYMYHVVEAERGPVCCAVREGIATLVSDGSCGKMVVRYGV